MNLKTSLKNNFLDKNVEKDLLLFLENIVMNDSKILEENILYIIHEMINICINDKYLKNKDINNLKIIIVDTLKTFIKNKKFDFNNLLSILDSLGFELIKLIYFFDEKNIYLLYVYKNI